MILDTRQIQVPPSKAAGLQQSFALAVIPPRAASPNDLPALETAMQSLALDTQHPVALEIVGTATSRQFVLRATSQEALSHLAAQIQARYPQAEIMPVDENPLCLREEEAVSLVELRPGAASYLSLRTWDERERKQREGADPLLGILAALQHLPHGVRVISQLALVPASPIWSQQYWRKAVEHPLEPERESERRMQAQSRASSNAPSGAMLLALALLVAILVLWHFFAKRLSHFVPHWILEALALVLKGKVPHLTTGELIQVLGGGFVLLLFMVLVKSIVDHIGQQPLYDMQQVREKAQRGAYQVRLRLFVIGPDSVEIKRTEASTQWSFENAVKKCQQWWSYWMMRCKAREERLAVLHRLIAAYRQYHQASGGYFLPQMMPSWKAERLLRQRNGVWDIFSGWEQKLRHSRHILSVAEVLALWHLPQALDIADIPLFVHGRARTLLAPIELTQGNGWHLGTSSHAGYTVPVCIPPHGLRGNVLAVASTGKGKSTLFQHLAQAHLLLRQRQKRQVHLIEHENGLLVIEPHGDMIATLCSLVPPELYDETVVIDLADQEHPPGINPLDMTLGRSRDKAVDTLLSIFKHIWDNSWGPRTENILEFSLKTLADANAFLIQQNPQDGPEQQYTLLDVIPLLRNAGFRHSVFEQVRDTTLLLWWRQYYEAMDNRFQTEVISSVVNKMVTIQ